MLNRDPVEHTSAAITDGLITEMKTELAVYQYLVTDMETRVTVPWYSH